MKREEVSEGQDVRESKKDKYQIWFGSQDSLMLLGTMTLFYDPLDL